MLTTLFLQVLNMSFTASVVILAVIALRLLLHRAPKVFSYALWLVVLFRLLCPLSFESVLSLFPANPQPLTQGVLYAPTPTVDTGLAVIDQSINPILPPATPAASANPMQIWALAGGVLWLAGGAALLLYSLFSLWRLRRRLRQAIPMEGNIYQVAGLQTPFVLGIFRPKIYLPASLNETEARYILLHEQIHIRRRDPLFKLLGFLALCIHWFNPLVWLAFFLASRDMEMSCDERVVAQLGYGIKRAYSSSLLSLAAGRHLGGAPLAFGEGDTKSRIRHVLRYRKPALWVTIVAALLAVALGIGLALNPAESTLKGLLAQAERFSCGQTEPLAVGRAAVTHYYETFMGEDIPAPYRITAFSIQELSLRAGDETEFCVEGRFTLATDGEYFLAGEGVPYGDRPGGECPDLYRQLRVKALGEGSYQIVEIGTGGCDQGLTPILALPTQLRQAYPEPYVIEADGDRAAGDMILASYRISLPGSQEPMLLAGMDKSTGALLTYCQPTGQWAALPAFATEEEAFIRQVLDSRLFADGALQFTLPPSIPNRYELHIEAHALIPESPGSTSSVFAFEGEGGYSSTWQAGQTYRETLFTGEIPDGATLRFEVYFTAPVENSSSRQLVYRGYSQWIFTDGQPKEAVRLQDTTLSVEQTAGQTAIHYAETDGNRFTLQLTLPAGWTAAPAGEDALSLGFPYGQVNLYNGLALAATISYNECDDLTGYSTPEQGNFRRALFSGLMLGSVVNWDNDYTPLTQTQTAGVATCQIMQKDGEAYAGNMAQAPEQFTPGILAYNTSLGRAIAIQFADNALTDDQLRQIAASITLR